MYLNPVYTFLCCSSQAKLETFLIIQLRYCVLKFQKWGSSNRIKGELSVIARYIHRQ